MHVRLPLLLCLLAAPAAFSAPPTPDHYRITPEVAQADAPRFSVNVEFGSFAPWNIDQRVNAWNLFYNLEPMVLQHYGQCDGGGVDFALHTSSPRFSFWDCGRSGYWDGAEVRFYRLENGALNLLRVSTVKRSVIGNDPVTGEKTEEKLYLADQGPAVRSGDLYVLRANRTEVSPHFRPAMLGGSSNYLLDGWANFQGRVAWRFDTNTFAPQGGSAASLRMELAEASPALPSGPWHWFLVDNSDEPHINLKFRPGKSYRAQVWLKQAGMSDPRAVIQLGCITTATVQVGTEWTKYEFDLPWESPAQPYPNRQNDGSRLLIGGVSPGTLWMDNLLVWQTDTEPFDILPEFVQVLKDFHPDVLRLWSGLASPSLDYWLSDGFAQLNSGDYGKSARPVGVSLNRSLRLCQQVGANPWLVLNPLFTAEEHAGLMEYLAGPPDRGYGRLRAQHGRKEPWTEAFKIIHLESCNESWNSIMPKNWSGRPDVYAAIADRQFRELKASPFFARQKFDLIVNGWDSQMQPQAWSHRVAMAAREADRIDMACYFGGWEKGATPLAGELGAAADEIYQDKLFSTPIEFGRKMVEALVLNPDLTRSLCGALSDQPALLARGLENFKGRQLRWTPAQLTPPAGRPAADAIRELWASDTNLADSIKSVLTHRRRVMENAFWVAAHQAMGQAPALQPLARAALRLPDNAIVAPLCEGLADRNAPDRLLPLLKTNEALVRTWLEGDFFPANSQRDVQAFLAGGEKLTYNITNDLGLKLRDVILAQAAAGNQSLVSELQTRATSSFIGAGVNDLDYMVRGILSEPALRRSDQLMLAMKEHPDFAANVMKLLATDTSLFRESAAQVARELSRSMAALYSGAESFRPYDEERLLVKLLPASVARDLLTRLQREVQSVQGTLSPEARFLLPPMIEAALGQTAPALTLEKNGAFLDTIEGIMVGALPQPFLEAAQQDTAMGDQLLALLARNPSPSAKGLAVYEGGPGYALPGPGKPPAEEDENLGKSLVMGTATLDVFMQFLAMGASPMAYYNFKSGSHWASHNNPIDLVPYPSWLSLQLVNRECRGDLLAVQRVSGATVDVPDKEIIRTTNDGKGRKVKTVGRRNVPLSACYAFRDGSRYAILLLNRDLKAARPVQLELPFKGSGPSRLFALTHPDPRTHNRSTYQVRIAEKAGPVLQDGLQVTIPPASVLLLVGEAR